MNNKVIPVVIDPAAAIAKSLRPLAIVDAILAKINTGTASHNAPIVIGIGPGFTAGLLPKGATPEPALATVLVRAIQWRM